MGRAAGGVVVLRVGEGVGEVQVRVDAVAFVGEARGEGEDVGRVVLDRGWVYPGLGGWLVWWLWWRYPLKGLWV